MHRTKHVNFDISRKSFPNGGLARKMAINHIPRFYDNISIIYYIASRRNERYYRNIEFIDVIVSDKNHPRTINLFHQ